MQALATDTSGMGEKRWQADMKAACANFDTPSVRKLARARHDNLMSSQDAPWMMDTMCALSRSCSKHKGDPAELATLLDLFLLDCEGRPRNNLKPSMATPWNDGLLASLLLMLDHPACEQWLRRHQVPIDSSGAHQWAGNAMRRMNLVDPMADPAFVCLDKDTGTTLQGAAIAIALFRGEDDNAIRKIAGRHPLTTKEIAICMARTLYRWEVDNALKTRRKTPSLEGLIWLHQQCPGSTIVQGAEAIFMNDENIRNIIVPFVNSLKKVEAELLQQRLDNRTATVPQHQHRNPRL